MKNLAGVAGCDSDVEDELKIARLPATKLPLRLDGEVPTSIMSLFGKFKLYRAWYYWVVNGPVPIEMALELYADPEGKKNVRVTGHCGCPPPEEPWIQCYAADGKLILTRKDEIDYKHCATEGGPGTKKIGEEGLDGRYIFSDDPKRDAHSIIVPSYHIDSQLGLCLFADMLRKYDLIPECKHWSVKDA